MTVLYQDNTADTQMISNIYKYSHSPGYAHHIPLSFNFASMFSFSANKHLLLQTDTNILLTRKIRFSLLFNPLKLKIV
jgi:hypothetical protein